MASNSGGGLGNLLFLLLPLLLLGFLMFSQRKRNRVMQEMQAGLAVGDEVVMTSGLYGRIVELSDATVTIDAEGARLRFDRRAVGMRVAAPPTTPTGGTASGGDA